MEITGLKANARAPDRVTVVIDGARFASLPLTVATSLGLFVGKLVNEDLKERLDEAAEVEKTYQGALRMLNVRPRAVNDLMRRLRAKGHSPSACARVIGRLETAGELDDEKFARLYAAQKTGKGFGRARVLADLLAQGVDGRVAETAVDLALSEQLSDPLVIARELAEKRVRRLKGLDRNTQKRRLLQYLARRGFTGGEIWDVVDEALRPDPPVI